MPRAPRIERVGHESVHAVIEGDTPPGNLVAQDETEGVGEARIGEQVGQRNLAVTANTYTHVLTDERELDYAALLAS